MYEFTEAERHAINDIYKREMQDMTPDEVALFTKWNIEQALQAEDVKVKNDAIMEKLEAEKASFDAQADAAINALEQLTQAALKRLEGIGNGEE